MNITLISLTEFIGGVVEDTIQDLFQNDYDSDYVDEIEGILLKNIVEGLREQIVPQRAQDILFKRIADRLSDAFCSCYTYNEETGTIESYYNLDIISEYRQGIKATINLNPYIAQYERI